jgi:hypothetical protein
MLVFAYHVFMPYYEVSYAVYLHFLLVPLVYYMIQSYWLYWSVVLHSLKTYSVLPLSRLSFWPTF